MAQTKEIVIKARLDTNDAVSKAADIGRSLKNIDLSKPNESLQQLNQRLETGNLSTREMTKLIKEYQSIAIQAGQTSPIGEEALKKAGDLKDKLIDTQNQIKVMSTDGKALNASVAISNTALQGYQAFIGLTQLAGGENKKLIQTMAKMQVLQQSLNAIEQVANQFRKGSVLTTYAMSAAYKMLGISATAASGGVRMLTKAIIATGIGAIVVGIGLLIAHFQDIWNWMGKLWEKIQNFTKGIPVLRLSIEALSKVFELLGEGIQKIKELFGGLTREQQAILDKFDKFTGKIDELTDKISKAYDRQIALAKAHGKDTEEIEKRKNEALIRIFEKKIKIYLWYAKSVKNIDEEAYKDSIKKIKELQTALDDLKFENKIKGIEIQNKENEEKSKNQEEWNKKHLKQAQEYERKRIEIAKMGKKDLDSIRVEGKEQEKKDNKDSAESEKTNIEIITSAANDAIGAFTKIIADKKKTKQAYLELAADLAASMGSVFEGLADMQEEGSKKQKKFAIMGIVAAQAQSIANAILAASRAAAELSTDPTGFGRIAVYITTFGTIMASIVSGIAQAKRVLGQSSSGDTSSSLASGASSSARLQYQESSGAYSTHQGPQPQGQQDEQKIKVYISETDLQKSAIDNEYKYRVSVL